MKKLILFLMILSIILVFCSAYGEDSAALIGSWRICGGTDAYDTLVFHADGTMEAYDFPFNRLPDPDKGYLIYSGFYELNGSDLTLANGDIYHMSFEPIPDDLNIGMMGPDVPKGTTELFLSQDPDIEDGTQLFGIYAPSPSPAVPLSAELPEKCMLNGEVVSLKDAEYDNGRLIWNGAAYSLQLTAQPVSDDMLDGDLQDTLEQQDRFLIIPDDSNEDSCSNYALTCETLKAYSLEGDDPLEFEMVFEAQ